MEKNKCLIKKDFLFICEFPHCQTCLTLQGKLKMSIGFKEYNLYSQILAGHIPKDSSF